MEMDEPLPDFDKLSTDEILLSFQDERNAKITLEKDLFKA